MYMQLYFWFARVASVGVEGATVCAWDLLTVECSNSDFFACLMG